MTQPEIRTSTQIRQSFLDFFKSKQHTIVPSSSLMPDAPNLLFTNAGMNQFVPIFLGQVKCPYSPPRAADTQKCIRAGGKHNDLDDVGLDTYHHTFFEMLGNWSFGDYFKKEAIDWAWELITEVWNFPKERLYATVFCPHMDLANWNEELQTAIEFAKGRIQGGTAKYGQEVIGGAKGSLAMKYSDAEAASFWAENYLRAGIDPLTHIVPGNRKDNFWMMGETGPCGPCSELHVDLTPEDRTPELEKRGSTLVNKGDARCIEIWNLVFIQFNANPDGTFSPLPSRHVDTGMGFERATSIIQGTKGFKDFANAKISNYETDIFRPIFDAIEKLSGKKYGSTLPNQGSTGETEQEKIDVAFRVIADHIRTLSFAIADGIQPGNTDRNYVLRRILRRAVRYGRSLGFHEPFFYKLVDMLAETMGEVFPEIREKKKQVQEIILNEEGGFNKTLDDGIRIFDEIIRQQHDLKQKIHELEPKLHALRMRVKKFSDVKPSDTNAAKNLRAAFNDIGASLIQALVSSKLDFKRVSGGGISALSRPVIDLSAALEPVETLTNLFTMTDASDEEYVRAVAGFDSAVVEVQKRLLVIREKAVGIDGQAAFALYDTYGFPLDLTELMARERGLQVDVSGFDKLMEGQKKRSQGAQKKQVISVSEVGEVATEFVGYDRPDSECRVLKTIEGPEGIIAVVDKSPLYAEMGGQVGDTGTLTFERDNASYRVVNTTKHGHAFVLKLAETDEPPALATEEAPIAHLRVDVPRRRAIERHHTVTHLLHWALHEVVSKEASQKGSFVGPEKLTFDFNSPALTPQQVADVEKLVNERIVDNDGVSWSEVPYTEVKNRKDVMQFFGDKYGDTVRVVQIGGQAQKLDGYSMELCGGTHTRATGEIGLFRITGENAIAAGVRRIEAVAGLTAYDAVKADRELIKTVAGKVNSPVHELEKKIESLLAHQKELERQVKIAMERNASNAASELLERIQTVNGIPLITHNLGDADGDFLQAIADSLKGRFKGVVVLGGGNDSAVALVATVSADFTAKVQAGKLMQSIAPVVGGKGGGKPDNARGGGKDATKLEEALAKVKTLLG